MTFKEKLELIKTKMFDLISIKEITFLKEMDQRIHFNKFGKYYYHNLEFGYNNVGKFLNQLENKNIYVIIPIISRNNRPDQPYIILSQQLLVTNTSSALLIAKYINTKFNEMIELYGISDSDNLQLVFKYKQVKIKFNEDCKFI
jgi:hypothetical protein